ncbi:MAG: ABC transporter permease [Planctomycetota bacterium]
MSSLTPPASVPDAAAPEAEENSRLARLTDWFNPVLVREVRQSVRSRVFLVGLAVALLIIAITAVGFAVSHDTMNEGQAFFTSLMVMLFLCVIIVPWRSLQALSKEVESGLLEQILLTRLKPRRIVMGHFLAALAHVTLMVCLFSPLLAMTFLLRGVEIGEVVLGIGFAFTAAIGISAALAAIGSLSRYQKVRTLVRAVASIGIVFLAFGVTSFIGAFQVRRMFGGSEPLGEIIGVWLIGLTLFVWLCHLVASANLSHSFENRSTGFRIHTMLTSVITVGTVLFVAGATNVDEAAPAGSMIAFSLALVFWLFASTEEDELNPYARRSVPKGRIAALFATPFLPGAGRGLLLLVLQSTLLIAAAFLIPAMVGRAPDEDVATVLILGVLYSLIYFGTARLVRTRLGAGTIKNWLARALTLLLLGAATALPPLIEAMLTGDISGWNLFHLLNPFWTIAEYGQRGVTGPAVVLFGIAAGILLANTKGIIFGVAEVQRISSELAEEHEQRHASS